MHVDNVSYIRLIPKFFKHKQLRFEPHISTNRDLWAVGSRGVLTANQKGELMEILSSYWLDPTYPVREVDDLISITPK